MAYCLKCEGEIGVSEGVCPHCGYDFPESPKAAQARGLLYSPLAEIALVAGQVAAALACLVIVIGIVRAAMGGELVTALVEGPLLFLMVLGVFVAFGRVRDL
jgi:hypothetical protein